MESLAFEQNEAIWEASTILLASTLADTAALLAALGGLGAFGTAVVAVLFAKKGVRDQIDEQRRITAQQIEDGRQVSRIERVARYVAVTHDTEFLERLEVLTRLVSLGEAEGKTAWEQLDAKDRLRIFAFLNFFEEMASAYHAGLLDKPMAREDIAYYAYHYWRFAGWFIAWKRAESLGTSSSGSVCTRS